MTDPRLSERLVNGEPVWLRCLEEECAVRVCYDTVSGSGDVEWAPSRLGPWKPVEIK